VSALGAIVAALALAASAAPAAPTVTCPASAASAGPVQWAFSVISAPSASSAPVKNSWTRGNGTWSAGRAHGTICMDDQGGGSPKTRIVLSASGSSVLSPGIRKLGLKGVGIVIGLRVSATDDANCTQGARGSVTLFASYYSVHRDRIVTRFGAACSDHDLTFTGSSVNVEISRNGAQVNST
jgi:hypothetical protein